MINHVFVYGTLKSGYGNNHYLRNEKKLFDFTTEDSYYLQNNGYPYAVPSNIDTEGCVVSNCPIDGEVWSCSEETLDKLDYLEGYEEEDDFNHYDRVVIKVVDPGGYEYDCWMYVRNKFSPSLPMCPVINGAYVWGRNQ